MALDGYRNDALDRFEAANPLPLAAVEALEDTAFAQGLVRSIRNLPRANRPWWKRFVIPVVIVVALGAGWTFYAVFHRSATLSTGVACYSAPSLHAHFAVENAPGKNPVATCALLWQAGHFGSRSRPKLEECVSVRGAADVFPSGDPTLCSRLALAEPTGTKNPVSGELALGEQLQSELVTAIESNHCLTAATLGSLATRDIHALGLTRWHVITTGTFEGNDSCAGASVESNQKTVHVIPEPSR
jgi:hypothetical protein